MQESEASPRFPFVRSLVFGLLILALIVFLLLDFTLGLALVIGVIAAWFLTFLFRQLGKLKRWQKWAVGISISLIALVLLAGLFSVIGLQGAAGGGGLCPGPLEIQAEDLRAGRFTVILLNDLFDGSQPLPQTVTSQQRGLILKEVRFSARELWPDAYDEFCKQPTVSLIDLPRGVYYQVKDARNIATQQYLNTETVTWSQSSFTVSFSYIPPALRFTRPLLNLFYNAGSLGEIAVSVGGLVFGWVIEPVIGDAARDRLKSLLSPLFPKRKDNADSEEVADKKPNEPAQPDS